MVRKYFAIIIVFILLAISTGSGLAQDDDDTTTTTAQSTVSYFIVICENQAVVNLNGTMLSGFDVYFQLFSGSQGTGTALSTLRRAGVSGSYTFSEIVTYNDGQTIPAGSIGSAYVTISRSGAPDNSAFNDYIDDLQDGCAEPQNPLGASVTEGGNAIPGSGITGLPTVSPGTTNEGTSNILSPFGGVVNPNYVPPPEDEVVVIGAREVFEQPRQETPGLVFAECNDYPVTVPGIVYDTDDVVVFWSWFAETAEQVQDHIDNVNYSVTYYQTLPLPNVVRSTIQERGGLFWVFYYSRLGNLLPGNYYIQYNANWDAQISDGIDAFGPGTDNEALNSGCWFQIRPNPDGEAVNHNPWPFQ